MAGAAFTSASAQSAVFTFRTTVNKMLPFRSLTRWNQGRHTRNVLSAMTDRQLEDIGMIRGDIDKVAFAVPSKS